MEWMGPRFDSPLQIVVNIGLLALLGFCIVDVLRRPAAQWIAAGQSRWLWIVVLLLAGSFGVRGVSVPFGPLLYLVTALLRVERARRAMAGSDRDKP